MDADFSPYGVIRIIDAKPKDLGGFTVRRALPVIEQRRIGPWVFFDEMGPALFSPGQGIDVRPHPHIGLCTVTYLFDGAIHHRDSLGSNAVIRPGDVNLMVAGSGIVHSEREILETLNQPRSLHGLQLWLALPEAQQEIDPDFIHYPANSIPKMQQSGVTIRLIMGQAFDLKSPVKTFAETLYAEITLEASDQLSLPASIAEAGLYGIAGRFQIALPFGPGMDVTTGRLTVIDTALRPVISATEPARLVLIGGEDIGPRHLDWNFVSTDRARLEQAKSDWREGRFPKVPGDETEFIPLP